LKYFSPTDAVFSPGYARAEAMNLTYLRKGLLIPTVRPIRDDVSARWDKKNGVWVPTNRWARLFTEMPPGFHSVNRLDFKRMGKEDRARLLEELGFAMGYMHRRRGVHGDPTLANLLIKHPGFMDERFAAGNVLHIDAESAYYAGEIPSGEDIRKGFVNDIQILADDARRLGLVSPDEERELLHNRFWNAYLSHWWAGSKPSRLKDQIEKLGRESFLKKRYRPEEQKTPTEEAADHMRSSAYARLLGERFDEAEQGRRSPGYNPAKYQRRRHGEMPKYDGD
jgi:tRNA A-37 threonylcarbamoyl transferase component Bud32